MPKKAIVYYDDPLPREITEIIVGFLCFSFRGLLMATRVCHWWRQIANKIHITKIGGLFESLLWESYNEKASRTELSRLLMWTSYRPWKASFRLSRQRDKYIYQLLRGITDIEFLSDMFWEGGAYYFKLSDGTTVDLMFKGRKCVFYVNDVHDNDVEKLTGISPTKFVRLCKKFDYLSYKVIDLGNIYTVQSD